MMNLIIAVCIIVAVVDTQALTVNTNGKLVDAEDYINLQIYRLFTFSTNFTLGSNMKLSDIEANATKDINEAANSVSWASFNVSKARYCHLNISEYLNDKRTLILEKLDTCVTYQRSNIKPMGVQLQHLLERMMKLASSLNDIVIECISDDQSDINHCVIRHLDKIFNVMSRYEDEADRLRASSMFAAYLAEENTLHCVDELTNQINNAVELAKKFLQICLTA